METHWPEIKALEEKLAGNDAKYLKEFIDLLEKNNQLYKYMYFVLCECTNSRKECLIRWGLFHEFAKSRREIEMSEKSSAKYIAIKVKGIAHWLWFETKKVKHINHEFIGKDGWGKGGALTNITVSEDEIIGEIHSENLQYT